MMLDLGCGLNPKSGYVGVDLIDAPGVIKQDMLEYLKGLADNSVDKVRAYQSLEHVTKQHFLSVFKEILRVCKNGAIIEVSLPYHTQAVSLTNPYHLHPLCNEHTFRFFCREKEDHYNVIPKGSWVRDYSFGLWRSANEGELPGYVRIKQIDYIYLPPFDKMSYEEKEFARLHYNNVVLEFNVILEVDK